MLVERIRLRIYLTIFCAAMVLGIFGFMLAENLSFVDALYFSIVTMSTVGYGDIHPQSALGKLLALAMIVGGVGTFLGVVASITDMLVNRREEFHRNQKLNMVMGVFFSELGTGLLKHFSRSDPNIKELFKIFKVSSQWTDEDFKSAKSFVASHQFKVDGTSVDFTDLRAYLQKRSEFLLRLIENPILQEKGNFTRLLRAIFHLRDELIHRKNFDDMLTSDKRHLEGDMVRVYGLLVFEWLIYMKYLHQNYDYLLSLAMRRNPFDPAASIVVN